MERKLIFVAGVHGVGKTSRCNKICSEFGFIYLNAGDIINSGKENINSDNDKRVVDVCDNQTILINGLRKYASKNKLLLDGHLTLIGHQYNIEKVPIQFLREINPTMIVLLINSPKEIVKNLKNRDSKNYDIDLITCQQQIESEYAEQVAKELNIPMIKFNSYDETVIIGSLKKRL